MTSALTPAREASADAELSGALVALASLREHLTKRDQKKPGQEREGARRTSQTRGRPGSSAAGTASAVEGPPPVRERRRSAAVDSSASLNRKRRVRKNRTSEQCLKKEGGPMKAARVESRGRRATPTDLTTN